MVAPADVAHGTLTVARAIGAVRDAPRLTRAMRLADDLLEAAIRTRDPAVDARRLAAAIDGDDALLSIASIHALGAVAHPLADRILLDQVRQAPGSLRSHASWVLAARRPSPAAVAALTDVVADGGFAAMLAERTLVEWSRRGTQVPASLSSGHRPATDRSHLGRARGDGLVVVQPFLHARLDGTGSLLGAGDAGGIASLLRSLGASLGALPDVDEVVTITRAEPLAGGGRARASARLGDGHRIERIAYGDDSETISWRDAWQYRMLLESEMAAIGLALRGRRVVWHLRMADVGTLAASAVARRLGQRVVFTAAADPHVVIDAQDADGRLTRANFGAEDETWQYWFRARMVERLSAQADHLALMPRADQRDLVELVGLDPHDLGHRADVVPEGVDVAELDAALDRHATSVRKTAEATTPSAVAEVLAALPPHRRALPWILSVGRLSPVKAPHRIVDAVAHSPELAAAYNVVLVGGDLDAPSTDERQCLSLIASARRDLPDGTVTLIGHRPPSEIADLLVHGAETGSIYVCASDKEEFGLAIVEALGAGMVVVAPSRGGPATYVHDGRNGMLCDTSSATALAAAIERAGTVACDRARIDASRLQVRAELSVSTMAERLAAVYRSLVPALAKAS